MKKLIFGISILMMSLVSIQAVAKDKKKATSEKATTECTQKECGPQKDGPQECGPQDGKCGERPCPFEGINLTDDQKSKIQAIETSAQNSRKALREEDQKAKQDYKKAKKERQGKMKEVDKKYLDDIQAVLTTDQFIVFLKNQVVNQPQGPKNRPDAGKPRMKKQKAPKMPKFDGRDSISKFNGRPPMMEPKRKMKGIDAPCCNKENESK